jgi:hypothetical protein
MAIREGIDQYIAYFRRQNQEIATIPHPVFRKALYLIEIDTLSRAAFPTESGHRKRVVQFIDTCSGWNDKDKVSAVQLKLSLEGAGIQSGELYDSLTQHITSWPYGRIIRPADDLTFEKIQPPLAPAESRFVNDARYAELLYTYRNHLLHEFREPGHGIDLGTDLSPQPYYIGMDQLATGQSSWELVFPVQFIQLLCEGCVNGLEAYLSPKSQDPYDSYEFGTMWRRSR